MDDKIFNYVSHKYRTVKHLPSYLANETVMCADGLVPRPNRSLTSEQAVMPESELVTPTQGQVD